MSEVGILVYGYTAEHVDLIREALEKELQQQIIVIGAAGMEQHTIMEILQRGQGDTFAAAEVGILMFLNFGDQEIAAALKAFPKTPGLKRPIFCGLTEQNVTWSLNTLIEHLLEEHRMVQQQRLNQKERSKPAKP